MRVLGLTLTACLVLALSACSGDSGKDKGKDKDGKNGKNGKDGGSKIDAAKLVGTWEPAKADPKAPKMTLEFDKGGKMKVNVALPGTDKPLSMEGTYKLEGDKLTTTGKGPDGKEQTETGTIETLTDSKLVLKKDGKTDEFKKK